VACRPTVTVQPQIYGALTVSSVISRITLPAIKKVVLSSTVLRIRTVHSLKVFQHLPDVNCHPILQYIWKHSAATRRISRK